jgi:virginiamycin A acetyltransferase
MLINTFKMVARYSALCAVIVPSMLYWISARLIGSERAFSGWSQVFSLFPGTVGIYLRQGFYGLVLPKFGRGVCISFGSVFSHPTACVGNNVYIGIGCMIGDATLEDDALIGSHVSIINGRGQHGIERLDVPVREQPGVYPRVTIGRDSWIGDRAVVTADVGRHAIVGAGAVTTRPVPEFAIVVGNPARIVNSRREASAAVADGHTHAADDERTARSTASLKN